MFEPLPGSGVMLSGSKVIKTKRDDGTEVMTTLQWAFVPADTELPDAWVEYDMGGEDWLPEDGNTVEAVLRWKANVSPSRVRFTLYEVSNEPGVSLNSKEEHADPDIEFHGDNKKRGFELRRSDKTQVAVKEGLSSLRVGIVSHARDFGAYGKLKAEIDVAGHWFEATARPFELPYLPVPYDKNNNLIADKWEKDVGIFGKNLDPNWDEDPYPRGQKSNGDGFTLYEEYRGFREIGHAFKKGDNERVKGGHVRTDPMYKDVFIYDRDGLFAKYYRPHNPADLNWHMIDLTMMKTTGALETDADFRWVNFNTSRKHFLRNQYALMLMDEGRTRKFAGITFPLKSCGVNPGVRSAPQPLKCNYKVSVYSGFVADFVSGNPYPKGKAEVVQDILTTTVIHEVGHALGTIHHTHGTLSDQCKDKKSRKAIRPVTPTPMACKVAPCATRRGRNTGMPISFPCARPATTRRAKRILPSRRVRRGISSAFRAITVTAGSTSRVISVSRSLANGRA